METSINASLPSTQSEQERLMDEWCILVSPQDVPLGKASKRVCHQNVEIRQGMLHRAFSVFLFHPITHKLLLQQRAREKITFPLHWTNTCCSHPLFDIEGEDEMEEARGVKRAAIRKVYHELGIVSGDIDMKRLHWLTRIHYGASSNGQWGEHEIDWILFIESDLKETCLGKSTENDTKFIPFSKSECESVRWVDQDELRQMMKEAKQGKLLLTPWFELIAEQLLFPWWSQLGKIIAEDGLGEEQKKIIHKLQEDPSQV